MQDGDGGHSFETSFFKKKKKKNSTSVRLNFHATVDCKGLIKVEGIRSTVLVYREGYIPKRTHDKQNP